MNDWKEQLKDVKRSLKKEGLIQEKNEKPEKIHFEPPKSWLDEKNSSSSIRSESLPRKPLTAKSRLKDVPQTVSRRIQKSAGEPTQQPAKSVVNPPTSSPTEAINTTRTPAVFRPRVESSLLNTPAWIKDGLSLQHPGQQGGKAVPMTVRIGVDFGTAFTKVAIRAGADLIVIDWFEVTGDDSATGRYVMPGIICRARNGQYGWQTHGASERHGNLKLPVIDSTRLNECPTAALAYLALVIRYARAYLYRHTDVGPKLMSRSLRWELNVGCPTKPHENPEVVQRLQRVSTAAWLLAAEPTLREAEIVAAWEMEPAETGLEAEPGVVPEFVAQIAGYLTSTQVTEGLHALIDIGAATLDVATFNVVLPNDIESSPRIPIFFSAVSPYGTHYLNHERHTQLDLELEWDDAAPVEHSDDFAKRHGKRQSEVDGIDSGFMKRVGHCINQVIYSTRSSLLGDPNSQAWRKGLPIFVMGGGSGCELYRQTVDDVQADLKLKLDSPNGFSFVELDPIRVNKSRLYGEAGSRLSVAIGLTEDSDNIARIIPHRDIEPIIQNVKLPVDQAELYGN